KMKTQFFLLTGMVLFMACNNESKDSVEKADSANRVNLDSNAASNGKAATAVSKTGADFLVKAMEGGMMEVKLGNIAKLKSKNKRVQDFGNMMIVDHSAAGEKIKDLASAGTVTLPGMTGDEKSKMIRDLNEKKASDFDKAYIDAMVDDHKEDIKEFESASDKVEDADIRGFIMATLPVLRKHLDSCTAIQESLEKKH
ncbi:MAG: hypothetical protein JWM28_4100, partial [Chitinophagaceae bacterium]|nr:hypothetical protein [Chitinophagaceae bacterium]